MTDRLVSGQKCSRTGVYAWCEYTDGTHRPMPDQIEQKIYRNAGENLPVISSSGKASIWVYLTSQ